MASKAHTQEYTDWVDRAFESDVQRHGERLSNAVETQRLDLLARLLQRLSDCYHMRGAVRILSSDQLGWHDVQTGYLAMSYCFQISRNLETGFISMIKGEPDFAIEIVAHLGLARLFSMTHDIESILKWLDGRFELGRLSGKSPAGRTLLASIFDGRPVADSDSFRKDRIECRRRRSAHPERLTENSPYGILDIEMALYYPSEAEFPYPEIEYSPTMDESVLQGIETYHQWLG